MYQSFLVENACKVLSKKRILQRRIIQSVSHRNFVDFIVDYIFRTIMPIPKVVMLVLPKTPFVAVFFNPTRGTTPTGTQDYFETGNSRPIRTIRINTGITQSRRNNVINRNDERNTRE